MFFFYLFINENRKLHLYTSFCATYRYEIEYDENRLKIGRDIGKRFLGIDFFDEDSENGEPEVLDNSTDTTANNENTISKCYLSGEKDELVLDVLNDDLISKVREKITRKYF